MKQEKKVQKVQEVQATQIEQGVELRNYTGKTEGLYYTCVIPSCTWQLCIELLQARKHNLSVEFSNMINCFNDSFMSRASVMTEEYTILRTTDVIFNTLIEFLNNCASNVLVKTFLTYLNEAVEYVEKDTSLRKAYDTNIQSQIDAICTCNTITNEIFNGLEAEGENMKETTQKAEAKPQKASKPQATEESKMSIVPSRKYGDYENALRGKAVALIGKKFTYGDNDKTLTDNEKALLDRVMSKGEGAQWNLTELSDFYNGLVFDSCPRNEQGLKIISSFNAFLNSSNLKRLIVEFDKRTNYSLLASFSKKQRVLFTIVSKREGYVVRRKATGNATGKPQTDNVEAVATEFNALEFVSSVRSTVTGLTGENLKIVLDGLSDIIAQASKPQATTDKPQANATGKKSK